MTSRTLISGRIRLSAISFLAVAILALSGCSNGDPQGNPSAVPASTASQSSSVTPSASPTPTPTPVYKPADAKGRAQNVPVPVKPALADKNSKEGLEAFTKYWYSLLSYGFETGDLATWTKISSSSCSFCNTLKNSVAVGYKEGRWQVGGRLTTPSVEARFKPGAASQEVIVQVIQEATHYYKADKTVGRKPASGSNTASVAQVDYIGARWVISDLHLLR